MRAVCAPIAKARDRHAGLGRIGGIKLDAPTAQDTPFREPLLLYRLMRNALHPALLDPENACAQALYLVKQMA